MIDQTYIYIMAIAAFVIVLIIVIYGLTRSARRRPDHHTLYITALQSLLDGDEISAFYQLKDVVSQDSDNIDAYIRLGKILADRGKINEAIQIHSELFLRTNLSATQTRLIQNALIDDFVADNQTDKAIEYASKLFDKNPRDQEAGRRLLELLAEAGLWEEAEEIAAKLYKLDNDHYRSDLADIRIEIASRFASDGRGKKARTLYKDVYHLDKSKAEVWVKIGDSYIEENRPDDAVKAWKHLTEISPEGAHLVFDRLKKTLFDLGQFNTISSIFESILEKDPNNQDAASALAELFQKKGNHTQAEEYYRHVLDDNPLHQDAILGIANLYREQGRLDEAFEILQKLRTTEETSEVS